MCNSTIAVLKSLFVLTFIIASSAIAEDVKVQSIFGIKFGERFDQATVINASGRGDILEVIPMVPNKHYDKYQVSLGRHSKYVQYVKAMTAGLKRSKKEARDEAYEIMQVYRSKYPYLQPFKLKKGHAIFALEGNDGKFVEFQYSETYRILIIKDKNAIDYEMELVRKKLEEQNTPKPSKSRVIYDSGF